MWSVTEKSKETTTVSREMTCSTDVQKSAILQIVQRFDVQFLCQQRASNARFSIGDAESSQGRMTLAQPDELFSESGEAT
jgi:hypothetical protein